MTFLEYGIFMGIFCEGRKLHEQTLPDTRHGQKSRLSCIIALKLLED